MLNNKTQRLILGVILLLLVDIIWVSSSELTKFLYENEQYDKPFFCTYFKTSMFTLYLVGLGVLAPWRATCAKSGSYTLVEQNDDDEPAGMVHSPSSLSDSTFVPIKTPTEQVSGTESDDSSVRSVRFNKLAEVREMSPEEASDALMSRLSYSASIRFRRQKTHHKTARTALMFCILVTIWRFLLWDLLSNHLYSFNSGSSPITCSSWHLIRQTLLSWHSWVRHLAFLRSSCHPCSRQCLEISLPSPSLWLSSSVAVEP